MSHLTHASREDKQNLDEPSWQFRNPHTPTEVAHMLARGEINATDLLLCWMIDAMVDTKGLGCYASNTYLAKQINSHPRHVSRSISKLVGLRLLIVKEIDNQRFMEASWSRLKPLIPPLRKNVNPPTQKCEPPPTQKCEAELNSSKNEQGLRSPATRSARSLGASGDRTHGYVVPPDDTSYPFDRACAEALREGLHVKRKLTTRPKMKDWIKEFERLRAYQDEGTIKRVLDWYVPRIGMHRMYQAFCASSFREKFAKIHQWMVSEAQEAEHHRNNNQVPEHERT